MISFLNSITDLDRAHEARDLALDCYLQTIRNIGQYAVELDPETTALHRKYLEDAAAQASSGSAEDLNETRATVRGLMRDYRDTTSQYLNKLRQELSEAVSALEQTLDALGQSDGDHDIQLRKAIAQLRAVPDGPGNIREIVLKAASTVEGSLEQVRKQHKLTVSQFLIEIRMLHTRIDALESAASIDKLTQLYNRQEIEERIKSEDPSKLSLLLLKARGLRVAETQFCRAVAEELAGAFTKRLRNSLPPATAIGRWNDEEFVAILLVDQSEATALGRRLSESLGGAYACLNAGKTVRPVIHVRVGIVGPGKDNMERVLEKVGEFLSAA